MDTACHRLTEPAAAIASEHTSRARAYFYPFAIFAHLRGRDFMYKTIENTPSAAEANNPITANSQG